MFHFHQKFSKSVFFASKRKSNSKDKNTSIFREYPNRWIEVNRYPNRWKSPRITGCSSLQSKVKNSVFLLTWRITKGILLKIEVCLKWVPEPRRRKISAYIHDGTWSWTYGVTNCNIRTSFRPTWKKFSCPYSYHFFCWFITL